MSILNCASSTSVARGYDYYTNNHVTSITQIGANEYEGYVNGNSLNPYYVKIDIEKPRKNSYCDCPFAKGNTVCKHMVALYFAAFPEEAEDYDAWMESKYSDEDYDDDDEYDYYYDYFYDKDECDKNYVSPLFFDEMLKSYIDGLSIEEQKQILYEELKQNEKQTLDKYLKKTYEKYLKDKNSLNSFIESLHKKTQTLVKNYEYNYKNYNETILSTSNKNKIKEIYNSDKNLFEILNKVLLNPELVVYEDYKWIAKFYKDKLTKEELRDFNDELDDLFNYLKHYSIRNTIPKSNILIVKHILNEYSEKEVAKSLLKNAKYKEYVNYIMDNTKNIKSLYKQFLIEVESNYINRNYIPSVLLSFANNIEDNEVVEECCYYEFLINGSERELVYLKESENFDKYYKRIISSTKNTIILEKLYKTLGKADELFNLLYNKKNEYRLIENIYILKEKHNEELYKYFRNRFYEKLNEGRERKIYEEAAKFIKAIGKLEKGEELVLKVIEELRQSEFSKRSALFEEIENAIHKY